MMERCNTCRFWIRETGFDRAAAAYGQDDAVYPLDYGACQRIHVEGNDRHHRRAPDEIGNPIIVLPSKWRSGGVVTTHERFGCQMHEEEA